MREKSSVVSLFLTRAGFVEFFVVFVKLVHGLTAFSHRWSWRFSSTRWPLKCVRTFWACCCFLRY